MKHFVDIRHLEKILKVLPPDFIFWIIRHQIWFQLELRPMQTTLEELTGSPRPT